jgi:hypothetical protein
MLEIRVRAVDLRPFPPAVRAVVQGAFRRYIGRAEVRGRGHIKRLFVRRSGALEGGVESAVRVEGLTLRGILRNRAGHAAAQELGADIPARVIRPVRAQALRWFEGGNPVFAMVSRPGPFHLPARPTLRPALEEEVPVFEAEAAEGLDRVIAAQARRGR